MNAKKYVLAVLAVLVFMSASGWLINDVLLKDLYIATAQYWRPNDIIQRLLPFVHLANFIFALLFCFVYIKGIEGKSPAGEGLRYGLLVGLLIHVPGTIMMSVFCAWPMNLNIAWMISGVIQVTLAGVVTGLIYRK